MSENADTSPYSGVRLKTRCIGRELHYLESTTSTQDIARELAGKGSPDGTAVIAGSQRSGRGRLGRSWFSPQGALATSIILRPPAELIHLLPAISSLSVFCALKSLRLRAAIKWPNDILIKGKKVCGILIENGFIAGKYSYSVVGIGINVNFDTRQYPGIADTATSLSVELKKELPVSEVAVRLFTELDRLYTGIHEGDWILQEWVSHMETIGMSITVSTGERTIEGTAEKINGEGNLVLRLADGSTSEIVAGDVTVLKDGLKK